jgi:YfiH family protein
MKIFEEPPNITSLETEAFFTTKLLGNIADKIDAVSNVIGISKDSIYLPIQKHTDNVQVVESVFAPEVADAVITAERGIMIGVMVADCVPLLLYDSNRRVIGAVHAGWRGIAQEILKKTIKKMMNEFQCLPEQISVAIGPCIRQCSYEVGNEVKEAVQKATGEGDYYIKKGDRYFVDLSSANRIQALHMGIEQKNIWKSEECTFCNPDKFHSYRYANDHAGRQGGFIVMW